MNNDYLIVHKSILPKYYESVIEARNLISKLGFSVSEACEKMQISRNTYYKYKDYVYLPGSSIGKRVIVAFRLVDSKGVLSSVLNFIAQKEGNILTINQEVPLHGLAYVTITIDCINFKSTLELFLQEAMSLSGVKTADLIALE